MPLKIAIPFRAQASAFGSGKSQAALAIAEVCQAAGHEVTLLHRDEQVWWGDIPGLEDKYVVTDLSGNTTKHDVVIDLDGCLDPDVRSALGTKVVVFFRSDPSFEYLEKAAYMSQETSYSLQGVHEVWVWDKMVGEERVPLLQTMLENLPVRRLPYVWTSSILEQYLRLNAENEIKEGQETSGKWTAIISEKNNTNTSSCILPLLGATKAPNVEEIILCNAAHLKENQFFQENLVRNGITIPASVHYEGRIRYPDLAGETSCLFVCHTRHVPFRPGLLDLLWLQLPLVHNCSMLKSVGHYYAENDLDGMGKAIAAARPDLGGRAFLESNFSIRAGVSGFAEALETLRSHSDIPVLRIAFSDMWEGFDPKDNFFLDLLQSVQTLSLIHI